MESDSSSLKNTEIIFNGKTITVCLCPQSQTLSMTFSGDSSSLEFHKAWNAAFSSAKEQGINSWLLDQTNMRIMPKDMDWLMKDKFPQFLSNFDKKLKLAIILSKNYYESVLTEDYTKKLAKEFPEKLQSKPFKNFDLAKAWLSNQPLNNQRIDAHNILQVMVLDRIKFSFSL